MPVPNRTFTLKTKIGAIQEAQDGGPSPGLFTELPPGSQIQIYDHGFSEDTVKVRCGTQLYFVFRQDIDASPQGESIELQLRSRVSESAGIGGRRSQPRASPLSDTARER